MRPIPGRHSPRAGFVGDEAFVGQVCEHVDVSDLSPEIARYFSIHISTVSWIARKDDAKPKT